MPTTSCCTLARAASPAVIPATGQFTPSPVWRTPQVHEPRPPPVQKFARSGPGRIEPYEIGLFHSGPVFYQVLGGRPAKLACCGHLRPAPAAAYARLLKRRSQSRPKTGRTSGTNPYPLPYPDHTVASGKVDGSARLQVPTASTTTSSTEQDRTAIRRASGLPLARVTVARM